MAAGIFAALCDVEQVAPVALHEDGDPVELQEVPARSWSSGPAHSAAIRLGQLKSKLKTAAELSATIDNDKMDLVRNVFGKFNATIASSGLSSSQNLALFSSGSGCVNAFDFTSKISQSMSRQKAVGIYSHITSQRDALSSFLTSKPVKHAVVTQIIL